MVLTVEKLNLQVKELEKQYNNLLSSFGNNVINYVMQYQANLNQLKDKIDLVHKQIG